MFLTPDYAPFAISFVIMIGVGVIEAVGLGVGQFDLDADVDAGSGGLLDWLGMGDGVPILIWLTSFLACFTIVGIALQQIVSAMFGGPLHWALAAPGALVLGGVLNGFASGLLWRIMPSYESTVISVDDLIMRRGTILEGVARRGQPARARVIDQHKQAHYIMVEPQNDADEIPQGETGLLVRKENGTFFLVPDTDTRLRSV